MIKSFKHRRESMTARRSGSELCRWMEYCLYAVRHLFISIACGCRYSRRSSISEKDADELAVMVKYLLTNALGEELSLLRDEGTFLYHLLF